MQAITNFSVRVVQRYLPSAFVLAVMLTAIVFVLGMAVGGESPQNMAHYWGDGFSNLFTFGMQMTLVLLTGYVLALTAPVQRLLTGLTRQANTPKQALVLTIVVSFVCYYLNWGFGMVAGAILAREMGRRVAVHFPLIVAAAYGESWCAALRLPSRWSSRRPITSWRMPSVSCRWPKRSTLSGTWR
ncbi:short-chain fatty acids transporter [Halomonas elongata]|uniref:Short-chain fatty acids transporter n=1 Tax=Halomonas elongata TaxID=2746 RepID=A0A1B8NXM9_HALEL|nr:TIGR00366 family protein [Halomonas elongata]OBX34781.1 short-chain fatty acids transporter [Halomonas elongata]